MHYPTDRITHTTAFVTPISSKGSFICIIPDRIIHTTAFVTPVVGHWMKREIAQWVHHEGLIRQPIALLANVLPQSCISLLPLISFQPVLDDWCNKGCGMYYPVCGMMHIKEPLLLIGKSSPYGGSRFLL